ncbi:hypothetical protein B0H15DRAFT_204000 [Mycena belliarum]|uniref:Thioredoxin domain-containing protein n=1 Tax=Mycena belliarum TaxID=1033014 RepID=A0AAD6UKB5_9AGAR|nr:hypothetical protein B0H15DRAFT_204000 [Mycena belliae]
MPLVTVAANPESLLNRPEEFLIFYSDVVDGKMWCSDCRAVDDGVQQTFAGPDAPIGVIVYVGNKPEWKAMDNVFRGEPFKITSIPTIIRLKEKKEVGRLVEDEITTERLSAFVQGQSSN